MAAKEHEIMTRHKSQINYWKIQNRDRSYINNKLQLKSISIYLVHNWEECKGEYATIPVLVGFSHSCGTERKHQDRFTTRLSVQSAGVEVQQNVTWRNGEHYLELEALWKDLWRRVDRVEQVDNIVQQVEKGGIDILGDWGSRSKIPDSGQ